MIARFLRWLTAPYEHKQPYDYWPKGESWKWDRK